MIIKKTRKHVRFGSTLISSMIAIAIIMIALIGTSHFRYYSALDIRKATAQTEASRIALLLCESWRGLKGDLNYNPITNLDANLMISSSEGPKGPDGFTKLGSYLVKLGTKSTDEKEETYHISYYTTLSWKDIENGLRMLNINISWAQKDTGAEGLENTDKSFSLTIYTETL